MKFGFGYSKGFVPGVRKLKLSLFETVLLVSLVLMCVISVLDALTGKPLANQEQLKMAKMQAQQEWMAFKAAKSQ